MSPTLLSQIGSLVTVDIDSMDPVAALRHDPMTFTDMTSNQALVYAQATKPENEGLVREAVKYVRQRHANLGLEPREYLLEALDVVTVRLAKLVFPHLKGKVHAQTSPGLAYDTQKTIAHAKRLVALFDEHGIPSSRVCIKIPATPESILACHALSKPDSTDTPIHTLATCVFSVPQALAARQAGCTYVAPYFNDLRVHFERSTWKEYDDPLTQHPMSSKIASIIAALKGSQTLVMPASIVTVPEVLALAALRPDHLTISAPLLDQLLALPAEPVSETLAKFPSETTSGAPTGDVDYLVTEGVQLKEAFMREPDISRRVVDALGLFEAAERRSMEYVRSGALGVEWDGVSGW